MEPVTAPTIVIGCSEAKVSHPAPARALYTGQAFILARAAAEVSGRPWFILSGLHGLLHPDTRLAPYDHTLRTYEDRVRLAEAIRATSGRLPSTDVEAWLSGPYLHALRGDWPGTVHAPLDGMALGYQKQWFRRYVLHNANTPLWGTP